MAFKKKAQTAKENGTLESFEILKATQYEWGTSFNMILNGVTIYNCTVAETRDGKNFISFPSRKGNDGKYYSYVYFRFSDADMDKVLEAVAAKL